MIAHLTSSDWALILASWLVFGAAFASAIGTMLRDAADRTGRVVRNVEVALNEDLLYSAYVEEAREAGFDVVDRHLVRRPHDPDAERDCVPMA